MEHKEIKGKRVILREQREEELTFYWSDEDYREFLEELKEYQQ